RPKTLAHCDQTCRLLIELARGIGKFLRELARAVATVGVDETGAFERYVEHRLERVIENGVSGMICKIRHQNTDGRVGQFWLSDKFPAKNNQASDQRHR